MCLLGIDDTSWVLPGILVLDCGSTMWGSCPSTIARSAHPWKTYSGDTRVRGSSTCCSSTELRLQTSEFFQFIQSHHIPDPCESLRESLFILRKGGIQSNLEYGLFLTCVNKQVDRSSSVFMVICSFWKTSVILESPAKFITFSERLKKKQLNSPPS